MKIKTRAQLRILTDIKELEDLDPLTFEYSRDFDLKILSNLPAESTIKLPPVIHLQVYDHSSYGKDLELMEVYSTRNFGGFIVPNHENFFNKIVPEESSKLDFKKAFRNVIKQKFSDLSLTENLSKNDLNQIQNLSTKPNKGPLQFYTIGVGLGFDSSKLKAFGLVTSSFVSKDRYGYQKEFIKKYRGSEELQNKYPFHQDVNMNHITEALVNLLKEAYKANLKYEQILLNKDQMINVDDFKIEIQDRENGIVPEPGTRVLTIEGDMNDWYAGGIVAYQDQSYKVFSFLTGLDAKDLRKKKKAGSIYSWLRSWDKNEATEIINRVDGMYTAFTLRFGNMEAWPDGDLNEGSCKETIGSVGINMHRHNNMIYGGSI